MNINFSVDRTTNMKLCQGILSIEIYNEKMKLSLRKNTKCLYKYLNNKININM